MMSRMEEMKKMRSRARNKRRIVLVVFLLIALGIGVIGIRSASFQRYWKSLQSNYGGGIDRTVTVYDYNGNQLRQYSGKFDIQESETTVFFDDENGRRIKIYNAIVISEENID